MQKQNDLEDLRADCNFSKSVIETSEEYPSPPQTSQIESFATIGNG